MLHDQKAAVAAARAIQQAGVPSSSRAGAEAGAILEADALAGSDAGEQQEEAAAQAAGECSKQSTALRCALHAGRPACTGQSKAHVRTGVVSYCISARGIC